MRRQVREHLSPGGLLVPRCIAKRAWGMIKAVQVRASAAHDAIHGEFSQQEGGASTRPRWRGSNTETEQEEALIERPLYCL